MRSRGDVEIAVGTVDAGIDRAAAACRDGIATAADQQPQDSCIDQRSVTHARIFLSCKPPRLRQRDYGDRGRPRAHHVSAVPDSLHKGLVKINKRPGGVL